MCAERVRLTEVEGSAYLAIPPAACVRRSRKESALTVEAKRPREQAAGGADTGLAWRCINTIRVLAMDAVQAAESGHPGTPMALAPAAWVLWTRHLRHDPRDPGWPDRDRFVLSCGHASMLLYGLLHLSGYDLSLDEIRRFRQWGSKTPGHPEHGHTPGVETTTGPLGQGLGNAVGMAIAERLLADRFNRAGHEPVNHRIWVFASDGDLMEGLSHEACSLAGHLGLSNLVVLYDDNEISIDGSTDLTFTEDVGARFAAYGWRVLRVGDGNDLSAIDRAYAEAVRSDQPVLIVLRSVIGDPAPTRRNTAKAHGEPLGADEVRRTKEILGWPPDAAFQVPAEVAEATAQLVARGAALHAEWSQRMASWRREQPDRHDEFERALAGRLPSNWDRELPGFPPGGELATRQASARLLETLAARIPELAGGSADLAGSTGTLLKDSPLFAAGRPGRSIAWGVREHAMASALNGMALHGGVRPYGSTFLIFSDYMRPAIRLAALMGQPVLYIFTHDSVGLGEDGPTHQPIEQLAALRAIPGLTLIRPADAAETAEAWCAALEARGPVALVLTRQKLPLPDRSDLGAASGLRRGGYVLYDPPGGAEAILIATGSEVAVALAAARRPGGRRLRVVSLPSWELFRRQPAGYREAVLPPALRARVSVEAGSPQGWLEWIGEAGATVGLDHFGASAPGERLFTEFGLTADAILAAVERVIGRDTR